MKRDPKPFDKIAVISSSFKLDLQYEPPDELALLEAKIAAMTSSSGNGAGGVPGLHPINDNAGGYGDPKERGR